MKSLALTLSLFFAAGLGADPCRDARNRTLTSAGELQNVVDAADLVTLSLCGDPAPGDAFQEKLRTREYADIAEVANLAAQNSIAWNPPPCGRDACELYVKLASLPAALRDVARQKFETGKAQAAGSGGLANIPDHAILSFFARHMSKAAGHYEIAADAASLFGSTGAFEQFSPQAAEVLADASRDADAYEWTHPAAHAQTADDDSTAELTETTADAQAKFIQWEKDAIGRVSGACGHKQWRNALYWTGYAFHGVQDLAFHNGISNAEHAWHDYGGTSAEKGVDSRYEFKTKYDLAVRGTIAFLQNMRAKLQHEGDGKCWSMMLAYSQRPPSNRDKNRLHHPHKTDVSLWKLIQFRLLADPFADHQAAAPQRYFVRPRWLASPASDFDPALYDAFVIRIFQ